MQIGVDSSSDRTVDIKDDLGEGILGGTDEVRDDEERLVGFDEAAVNERVTWR